MDELIDPDALAVLEKDLVGPNADARKHAARSLAELALNAPNTIWPKLIDWGGESDDPEVRDAIGAAVARLLDAHFEVVVPHLAQASIQSVRFGNVALPFCLDVMHGDRYKLLQNELRAASKNRLSEGEEGESTSLEDILNEDDLDFFAMNLLEYLMCQDELSEAGTVAYQVLMLANEVPCGGLAQFYYNGIVEYCYQIPGALCSIGASRHAKVVEGANAVFGPDGPPCDIDARRRQMGKLGGDANSQWEQMTTEFLGLSDDLIELLQGYVCRRKKDL